MKLGEKIEIGNAVIVYAGLLVVLVIVLLVMWGVNKDLIIESWHRDSVINALVCDDNLIVQKGIDACKTLIDRRPEKVNLRMILASIDFRTQHYADAAQVWQSVADHPQAT